MTSAVIEIWNWIGGGGRKKPESKQKQNILVIKKKVMYTDICKKK